MSCNVGEVTKRLENELYDYNYELCSFSNLSVALPTSQLIHQPFRCFTYITVHSPTLLSLLLRHKLFTYVTWRAANDANSGIYPLLNISLLQYFKSRGLEIWVLNKFKWEYLVENASFPYESLLNMRHVRYEEIKVILTRAM